MKLRTYLIAFLCIGLFACQEDDQQFGELVAPSNITINAEIVGVDEDNPNGDGSGKVNFAVSADNAITYRFFYGDNVTEMVPGGSVQKTYNINGVNLYTFTAVAFGTGGISSSKSIDLLVRSDFEDIETTDFLTGGEGNTKTWYIAFAESGHLGVGPAESTTPDFFSASPNLLADCFYDDIFNIGLADGDITFTHDNNDVTFFNQEFVSVGGGVPNGEDQCQPFDTSGNKFISLSAASSVVPEDETTGTAMNITDDGFIGYYINTSTYEVIQINETSMSLRALSGSANPLAWYLKLTTNPDGTIDD